MIDLPDIRCMNLGAGGRFARADQSFCMWGSVPAIAEFRHDRAGTQRAAALR